MRVRRILSCAGAALTLLAASAALAERPFLTLAAEASLVESRFLAAVLPKFSADAGVDVRVVAVPTGRALALGKRGAADVLLVDDRAAEDLFVQDRHALARTAVMRDDFLIVGHASDPAGVADVHLATIAFSKIADKKAPFVSRGDDSGAHRAERRVWAQAGRDPSVGAGSWYFSANGDLAAAVALASTKRGYTLADRASWLALSNRRGLVELLAGDVALRNAYALLVVNDMKHKGVKFALGKKLSEWLTGYQGRNAIAGFRIASKPVFVVD